MFKRFLIAFFTFMALTFGFVGTAGAQDECEDSSADSCEGTDVGDTDKDEDEDEDTNGVDVGPKTLPDTDVQGRQQLPVTGSETVTLVLGGAALVGAGGLMVRRSTQSA